MTVHSEVFSVKFKILFVIIVCYTMITCYILNLNKSILNSNFRRVQMDKVQTSNLNGKLEVLNRLT